MKSEGDSAPPLLLRNSKQGLCLSEEFALQDAYPLEILEAILINR